LSKPSLSKVFAKVEELTSKKLPSYLDNLSKEKNGVKQCGNLKYESVGQDYDFIFVFRSPNGDSIL
jgi:hypothetical protein